MNAKEIRKLISEVPDEAELIHIWTTPQGDPLKGADGEATQPMRTKLYFKKGDIKTEVPLEHDKKIKKKQPIKKHRGDRPLTQKMGNFFKGGRNATSDPV